MAILGMHAVKKNYDRNLQLMKAFLVLSVSNFLLLTFAEPLPGFSSDDSIPGKVHELYQQYYSSYKKYLKDFNKQHDISVPEPVRLLKFAEVSKMINEHNERYKRGLAKFEMGLNEMSDWTEEKEKSLFGIDLSGIKQQQRQQRNITQKFLREKLEPGTLPSSVDYRKDGVIGPVKNQGVCNVCYLFTAVAAVEAYTAIRTHKPVVPLSEQQVMDCAEGPGMGKCKGRGGVPEFVFDWLATTKGLMAEKDYPYKKADNPTCLYKPELASAKVHGSAILPKDDILALKKALAALGPVAVGLHASSASFKNYKGGIYDDVNCPFEVENITHAVLAVGYGEEGDDDYIIIKNSWGTSWGEQGYARILASPLFICGLGRHSAIPLM